MNMNFESFIKEIKFILLLEKNKINLAKINDVVIKINKLHPADISDILENVNFNSIYDIFSKLHPEIQADVFMQFSNEKRKHIFLKCSKNEREVLLNKLRIDELVDFFDDLSDNEVSLYIKLLNKNEREKVISLLEFPETSAAGIMDIEVFVLPMNINVSKTINLLQRLNQEKELYRTIFIVDSKYNLMGKILLEDLILNTSDTQILKFMKKIEYSVNAFLDQEHIAEYMTHYEIDIVPVIDENNKFLGVISSDTLAKIIENEASEDILRMAALSPIEDSYFETSIFKLIYQRAGILIILLLIQSISTLIIGTYQSILAGFLISYIGMITSTGGNSSSQVSVLAIQGLASGELKSTQMLKFLKRELSISFLLGLILSIIGFIRIYIFNYKLKESFIIAFSIFSIIIISTILASTIPFLLRKINIDPAYAAGPLLATFMDIIGVIIFISIGILLF